jgi:hypothetical protein
MRRTWMMNSRIGSCLVALFLLCGCSSRSEPDDSQNGKPVFLYPVIKGGKEGYIDQTGRLVIRPTFDDAFDFSDGLASVRRGDDVGYIDMTGSFAFKPRFIIAGPFSEGMARVVPEKGAPGYIDRSGQFVLQDLPFGDVSLGDFSEGLASVKVGPKVGFIDKTGKMVIEPRFDEVKQFIEGRARVKIDGAYGFIDRSGELVIPARFADAG